MIKSLSPHYKTIPWMSPSSGTVPDKYILNVYLYNGLKSTTLSAWYKYEVENINPLGRTGDTEVDISKYISDFITNVLPSETATSLADASGVVWVRTEVIYYIGGVAQSAEFEETDSAVKGYGYSMEGVNPSTPVNNYLATTVEQKVSPDSIYLFSFLASETVTTDIRIQSINNMVTLSKAATTDSNELAQLCYIKVSEFSDDDYIDIYKDDVLINTLLITNEYKYTPIDVVFLNKEGQLQTVTLFKEKVDSLNIDREDYESSNGQPSDGVHQYKNYNVNGRDSFTMNSGFIKEDNNEVYTQLLLSSMVWQLKDNVYTPLNLGTDSLEYKTRQKDRLINYKIDFKYSFNKVNNI